MDLMYSFFLRIHLSVLFLRIRLSSKIYFSLSLARPLRSFDTVALAFTLCAFILTSIGLEFVKNLSKKLGKKRNGKSVRCQISMFRRVATNGFKLAVSRQRLDCSLAQSI